MAEQLCPAFKTPCIEHRCKFYVQLLGNNPQTGVQEAKWDCAVAFLPILIIETSKEVRQAAAATESFRNEVVEVGEKLSAIAAIRATPIRVSLDGPG